MRPRSTSEVEDQVDFLSSISIPLFVHNVFNPVECGESSVVEQDIDLIERLKSQVNQGLTVSRLSEVAGMKRYHCPAPASDHLDGMSGSIAINVASDNCGTLLGEE